ncbi:hypothetical protein ABEB36_000453 [Hypothenemus hampei]|uniref:Uncharacterized protein n=1 Tax=Hypothenemus hampei TaxID=57062 RepID=A0ABD1FBA6_HYPHA
MKDQLPFSLWEVTNNDILGHADSGAIHHQINDQSILVNVEIFEIPRQIDNKEINLYKKFWEYAVLVAAYITNRTESSIVRNKTPYELWIEKSSNVRNMLSIFANHNDTDDEELFENNENLEKEKEINHNHLTNEEVERPKKEK